jgi:hypothetical protein
MSHVFAASAFEWLKALTQGARFANVGTEE